MMLSYYIDDNPGINLAKVYLKSGENDNYIYLISPKGFYTNMNPEVRNKKIRLNSDMEVEVSSDMERIVGFRVIYLADKNHY